MSPLLSWVLLLTILGAIGLVSMVVGHVDETPADPTGWRPLEEEANRFRIIRPPYDQDQEDQV